MFVGTAFFKKSKQTACVVLKRTLYSLRFFNVNGIFAFSAINDVEGYSITRIDLVNKTRYVDKNFFAWVWIDNKAVAFVFFEDFYFAIQHDMYYLKCYYSTRYELMARR